MAERLTVDTKTLIILSEDELRQIQLWVEAVEVPNDGAVKLQSQISNFLDAETLDGVYDFLKIEG